jgi:hypothetical protein
MSPDEKEDVRNQRAFGSTSLKNRATGMRRTYAAAERGVKKEIPTGNEKSEISGRFNRTGAELRREIRQLKGRKSGRDFSKKVKQELAAKKYVEQQNSDFAAKTKELQALWNRLNMQLNGDNILASHEFETTPGIYGLIETSMYGLSFSTVGPTQSHIDAYKQAKSAFDTWTLEAQKLDQLYTELQALLDANQVPYTPGRTFFLNRN